jgi:hypothetical protein
MQKTYIAKNEHISILHSTHYVDNLRFLGTPPLNILFLRGVSPKMDFFQRNAYFIYFYILYYFFYYICSNNNSK